MAYYAPPGGSLTARVARALQDTSMNGLGILPSINVRASRLIPAAIGAARRFRAEVPPEPTMTGMGVVNVRPPNPSGRYAQPAPITFAATRAAAISRLIAAQAAGQPTSMSLSGPKAHHLVPPAMPTIGNIRRQAAMFMTPGGGYSQIPGFMPAIGPPMRRLSGLGQEDTTMIPAPDVLTPPPDIFTPGPITLIPTPSIPIEPTTYSAPTTLTPPQTPIAAQNVPFPKIATGIAPSGRPVFLPSTPPTFMQSSPLGVPNKYLIVAAAGIVMLTLIAGRRRRNPRRARRAW